MTEGLLLSLIIGLVLMTTHDVLRYGRPLADLWIDLVILAIAILVVAIGGQS